MKDTKMDITKKGKELLEEKRVEFSCEHELITKLSLEHPDLTEFSATILNARSNQVTVSREYDNEQADDFVLRIKCHVSGWMKVTGTEGHPNLPGKRFVDDNYEVLQLETRDEVDDLIKLIQTVRDHIWKE